MPPLTITSVVVFILLLRCCSLSRGQEQSTVFQISGLKDRHFQEGQLFAPTGVASAVECARLCAAETQCHTFTFTPTGSRSCRAYDVVMTSESSSMSVKGAVSYQRVKEDAAEAPERVVWKTCVTNEECPAPQTQCFKGQCLCSPGYYFSMTRNACVDGCKDADLKDVFMKYQGSSIFGQGYIMSASQSTLPNCFSLCRLTSTCSGLVFRANAFYCSLYTINTIPFLAEDWKDDTPDALFAQRVCA
ncbi:hypothetical protein ACOMHN_027650 [Nucella lapillus]